MIVLMEIETVDGSDDGDDHVYEDGDDSTSDGDEVEKKN